MLTKVIGELTAQLNDPKSYDQPWHVYRSKHDKALKLNLLPVVLEGGNLLNELVTDVHIRDTINYFGYYNNVD